MTRPDIDKDRIGYYSLSMGAYFGPIPVSLEPRIKVAVFASGGLRYSGPAEIQPANFAPHVKVPVLLVNGKNDFQNPPGAPERMLELLGTPPEHKKLVKLEGGHVPNDRLSVIGSSWTGTTSIWGRLSNAECRMLNAELIFDCDCD